MAKHDDKHDEKEDTKNHKADKAAAEKTVSDKEAADKAAAIIPGRTTLSATEFGLTPEQQCTLPEDFVMPPDGMTAQRVWADTGSDTAINVAEQEMHADILRNLRDKYGLPTRVMQYAGHLWDVATDGDGIRRHIVTGFYVPAPAEGAPPPEGGVVFAAKDAPLLKSAGAAFKLPDPVPPGKVEYPDKEVRMR